MTGYGKAVVIYKERKIGVELKSLNSKSLDLSVRMANIYRDHEMEVRQMVAKALERGKVDVSVWVELDGASQAATINGNVLANYYKQMAEISATHGLPLPDNILLTLLRLPEVTAKSEPDTIDDEEWCVVKGAIEQAIAQLQDFRRQEGAALERKFAEKVNNIEALLAQLEPLEKCRVEKIKGRIIDALATIPEAEYDKNRLEQELIYYIEKLDISEEKQRLANHIDYFRKTMADPAGQGKKLGFIAQEMGREINTTGSKSNLAEMQNIVVKMKDELEQIKEQVLNAL